MQTNNQNLQHKGINSLLESLKLKFNSMSENSFQILIFFLFVSLEIFLAILLDTTLDFDAVTRASAGLEFFAGELGLDFVQWLPFFRCGVIWLPMFQWLIGIIVVFPLQVTELSVAIAVLVGEIISALAAAGTAIYVYRILRKFFELDRTQASFGFIFLLASGQWVAHGSQAMTEVLSNFLLVATCYHVTIFLSREANSSHHIVIASILSAVNNFLRYEVWVFICVGSLLLIGSRLWKMIRVRELDSWYIEQILRLISFLILPSLVCFVWLLHTFKMTGSFTATTDWIIEHTGEWGLVSVTAFNPLTSLIVFFERLTLASIFWVLVPLFVLYLTKNSSWLNTNKPEAENFLLIQGIILGLFILLMYSLIVLGISTSAVRHFLVVVPFVAIIGAILCAKFTIKITNKYFLIGELVGLGVISILVIFVMNSGGGNNATSVFYYLIPYLAIVALILYVKRIDQFNNHLRYFLYASLILSGATIIAMHIQHLLHVILFPENFIF